MRVMSAALPLVFVLLAGCGSKGDVTPSTYKVGGKVLLASGAPAHGAEIGFIPKLKDGKLSGANGFAVLGKDGTFTMKSMGDKDGLPAGYYVVVLNPNVLRGDAAADKAFGIGNIPKKYWSEDSTDYSVTIDADKPDLTIQLTK